MRNIFPILVSLTFAFSPLTMAAKRKSDKACDKDLTAKKSAGDDAQKSGKVKPKIVKIEPTLTTSQTKAKATLPKLDDANLAVGQGFLDAGLKQIKVIAEQQDGKSFVYSPLSLYSAMAVLTAGAKGETEKALLRYLLGNEYNQSTLVNGIKDLYDRYQALSEEAQKRGGAVIPFEFVGAQSVVSNQEIFDLNSDYTSKIKRDYNAEIFHKTFNASILSFINAWVSEKTKGLIPELLTEPLKPDVVLVILNAIYAKGSLAKSFELMKEGRFKAIDGTES